MRPVREIVKREDWQELRRSFIGTWNKTPDENVRRLREWLGPVEEASNDELRIVMNYLTGTGFRTGTITNTPEIRRLRKEISIEIQRRKDMGEWY
jgi:hypothetical protein